ncbi:MAG: exodeoxyribonuclease VII small subunit [Oscillospiraceae bacterium]
MGGKVMTFEENIKRLEDISEILDNPEIDLDSAIELYKESMGIIKKCNTKLQKAELTINKINESVGEE